jgi:hypothetical protein
VLLSSAPYPFFGLQTLVPAGFCMFSHSCDLRTVDEHHPVTKLRSCRGGLAVAQTEGLLTPPLDGLNYNGTRHCGLLVHVTRYNPETICYGRDVG